jgi:hypothetical protein
MGKRLKARCKARRAADTCTYERPALAVEAADLCLVRHMQRLSPPRSARSGGAQARKHHRFIGSEQVPPASGGVEDD